MRDPGFGRIRITIESMVGTMGVPTETSNYTRADRFAAGIRAYGLTSCTRTIPHKSSISGYGRFRPSIRRYVDFFLFYKKRI